MLRNRLWLWCAALPLLAVQPLLASSVQVGTCKGRIPSYPTISAAVAAVPPGSTVQVCPGTYAEQVTITVPLNLTGVASGTSDQILITVPSGGLVPNTVSMAGQTVAAQVLVQSAAPVNITNISVDGTGGDMACASNTWIAGFFYSSTSSGTVFKSRASGQTNGGCGVGIWAENADSTPQSVTIQNNSVYNADDAGIFVASGATPSSLSVNLLNNAVNGAGMAAILADNVTGLVRNNDITNSSIGMFVNASGVTLTSNTIVDSGYGMFLESGGTANNNDIVGSNIGVLLAAPGATLQSNRIVSSASVGVEMDCFSATVSGNFINDTQIGLDQAPAGLGTNTFANDVTTSNGCVAAAAQKLKTNARQQLRTPSTPFGGIGK